MVLVVPIVALFNYRGDSYFCFVEFCSSCFSFSFSLILLGPLYFCICFLVNKSSLLQLKKKKKNIILIFHCLSSSKISNHGVKINDLYQIPKWYPHRLGIQKHTSQSGIQKLSQYDCRYLLYWYLHQWMLICQSILILKRLSCQYWRWPRPKNYIDKQLKLFSGKYCEKN